MNRVVLNAPRRTPFPAKMPVIFDTLFCQQWPPWPPTVDARSLWRLPVLPFPFNWLCDKLRSVRTLALLPAGGCVMVASALNLASNNVRGDPNVAEAWKIYLRAARRSTDCLFSSVLLKPAMRWQNIKLMNWRVLVQPHIWWLITSLLKGWEWVKGEWLVSKASLNPSKL